MQPVPGVWGLGYSITNDYGIMGWDTESGVPTLGKLQELDIGWAAQYLPKERK